MCWFIFKLQAYILTDIIPVENVHNQKYLPFSGNNFCFYHSFMSPPFLKACLKKAFRPSCTEVECIIHFRPTLLLVGNWSNHAKRSSCATHCSKCALVGQSLLASKTLFSQCVRAVPSSPWSSSSAPSRSLQPKWLRTSSTTWGVTIICTSRSTWPTWTSQLLRTTDLITRSLHCLVRSLENQSQLFLYIAQFNAACFGLTWHHHWAN